MSYDLAFWDGPPADDAVTRIQELLDAQESEDREPEPPTSRIAALVHRLETRWPMTDEPPWAPWASWPIGEEDADGAVLYVNLTFDGAEEAVDEMVAIARELGVVCYDPQLGALV